MKNLAQRELFDFELLDSKEGVGEKGAKKLLVFSPAFVADCLETTIEIGDEYQELFEEHGGEKVQLVPSLNDSEVWIDALVSISKPYLSA